jgi:hypothetical protein
LRDDQATIDEPRLLDRLHPVPVWETSWPEKQN